MSPIGRVIASRTTAASQTREGNVTGDAMLIELDGVTKTYGKIPALGGLTVVVPEGPIGLLGPNGAGKTTMIRSLLGLIALDAGQGKVLGMDIRTHRLDIRQAVGFVPEDECLFPGVVGVQFVAYAGELVGMSPQRRARSGPTRCSTTSGWARPAIAGSSRTRPA